MYLVIIFLILAKEVPPNDFFELIEFFKSKIFKTLFFKLGSNFCRSFNVNSFNFGNITINIDKYEIEENINQFKVTERLLKYKFISPWIALNKDTGGEYRFLSDREKPLFLNKLLGQNLLFIAKELGEEIITRIYTKVIVDNNVPEKIDDNGWGAFVGEFKTNFILPSYTGLGNGITRGLSLIHI